MMRRSPLAAVPLAATPPELALRHSAAVAVLAKMGFRGSASDETFKGYIKGLRKLGIPFNLGATRRPGVWLALYAYEHLMELAVALSLRTYNILPDSLVDHLIAQRDALNPLYVEAWRQCARDPRLRLTFRNGDGAVQVPAGPYLDLRIAQHGRAFGMAGPPRLISTAEALKLYGATVATAFLPGPVRISGLVRLMAGALEDAVAGPSRSPLEAHTIWLLEAACQDPPMSLEDMQSRIAEELGLRTSQRSLRRFFERHAGHGASGQAESGSPQAGIDGTAADDDH